jgi:GT2 family glycosyltransferase
MNADEIILSVIILNYRDVDLTAKCVKYLEDSANDLNLPTQIIIVDNSAAETSKALKELFPHLDIIENYQNVGFSKANNQGIMASRGKYILLLNNDAFVNSDCLKNGINYLENNDLGIWAPRLVGEDGNLQISSSQFPSLNDIMGEYFLFKNYNIYNDFFNWKEPKKVDFVIGAFILMKIALVDEVGLLDEAFFFNGEDVDYCKRVHEKGYTVTYDPRYSVVHIGGASQTKEWFRDPFLHKNRIIYSYKHYNIIGGLLAHLTIRSGLMFRKILWWISNVKNK